MLTKKNKFVNVLIYHGADNYLIFLAYAALIKSSEDFCLEGIEICNVAICKLVIILALN